ncbi:inositol 1,4,5-triphosphate receptor associated 2 isoform X3 [Gadus morhua]|uniref:inositol 1,4,5-triphosphate receptor associated 2 isoform X3 n=1 Tax=Gadus morhua TaxID=8049 RepID=UPI0011B3F957|nr:lymphoid-restricted membrane protein-like isoform X3 [Gadus morhua]
MDPCPSSSPLSPRRHHNPVDSICRKLQSIQWCGDRQPHSPFQIPKLSSGGHQRTPHAALRSDLDPILKKRPAPEPPERGPPGARGRGRAGPTGIPGLPASRSGGTWSLSSRHAYGYAPATPIPPQSTPTNLTCSVSSTPGERRDWVGATGAPGGRQGATWQRYCSTPTTLTKDSVAAGLAFSSVQQPQTEERGRWGSPSLSRAAAPPAHLLAYDPDLGRTADSAGGDGELAFPALVVRRLSLGESAFLARSETRKETMAEVSLICEEDLLDTIFHACDTQHRGRVYVSCIVDYLRHTTSRTSEDSGLEELCNMLDPERTDVSIDLDTYHAIMKEWINDCRSNGEDPTEDLNQDLMKCKDVLSAKRSMLLNMTSGSLEAFGGEASLVELETSELVYCVADLQMSNQRLQEEMKTLKQTAELLEEGNQRLVEENGELRAHARHSQQMAQREKMLKEELEEMKAALSSTEEGRARAQAHGKNLERENHGLTTRITSLEEENFKVTMEMEDLQGRLRKLCDINADLQVQIHSSDGVLAEKEQRVQEKSRRMEELKKEVEEYSSLTELLRADKTQLETQMRMCHPDMTGRSVSLSVAYRLNQSTSGSLQTELALAQSPQEGEAGATMLDETLDKEVLLLLQGPNPEHMALEFRALLSKLKAEFRAEAGSVLSAVRGVVDPQPTPGGSTEPGLQAVQGELEARRADWVLGLDQLAQYADSLEKELIKMASNMRRSRTEILHLSVRVQEQENQKRQLGEELETLRTPQDSREAPCQVETPQDSREPPCQARTELEWDAEFDPRDLLKKELDEKQEVVAVETLTAATSQPIEEVEEEVEEEEEEAGEERWTVVEDLGGGDEPRDASTPLPAPSEEPSPGLETLVSSVVVDPESSFTSQPLQEAGLCDTHTEGAGEQAGQESSSSHSEALHSHNNSPECTIPLAGSNHDHQRDLPEMDQTVAPGNTPPGIGEMVPPIYTQSSSPGQETIVENGGPQPSGDPCRGGGEGDEASSDMSLAKSPTRVGERGELEDSSSPLPVVMEEEEGASQTVSVPMAGSDSSPNAVPGREDRLSESSHSTAQLQRSGKTTEDLSEASEKDGTRAVALETSVISDGSEVVKEERQSHSQTDKEIEVEFQRLSLGFKCDLFTLEKRLRLEERSRDLAEENVRKEISSCQGLLQALIPLCDDDSQSIEIVHRLQKNLEILIQSMTRVSSRSEMLGAIHQEHRVGRAVEVMFQHVENLKRMYTKEHTELVELRQTLMQNERSFGSQTDKADFRGKSPSSQYYKPSARRVSIAAIPRSGGSPGFDSTKTQDLSESEAERLTRRSPWNVPGKSGLRPPLKRFISSGAWGDPDEPGLAPLNGASCSDFQWKEPPDPPEAEKRRSSLTELGHKLTSFIMPTKTPSSSPGASASDALVSQSLSHSVLSHPKGAGGPSGGVRGGRGLWLWLAMVVVLAGLLALLACLVMQPAVDAAPVGTGDSWMTIQQLLWPYTGLRHNGQPPV